MAGHERERSAGNDEGADLSVPRPPSSLADVQLRDHAAVAIEVPRLEIVEQASTPTDELEQAPPGVEVLAVRAKVIGEVRDPPGEERDLDFGATRVACRARELADDLGLAVRGESHCSSLRAGHAFAPRCCWSSC